MMKIDIAIENGRSLKLCQTRQVSLVHYKHTTNHERRLHSPTVGCQEGQEWVERGGEWSKEDKEK
jgi:hypothetical protein